LLEVLTNRRARAQLETIYANTGSADESVRVAAIHAVEVLAKPDAAPRLLALLTKAKSDAERGGIEKALAATCSRAETVPMRAFQILAAIKPDQPVADYASLLRVLGHIGGADALAAIRTALQDKRDEIREAALSAMLDWPDPAAADDVLKIAQDTQELKHHVLALRAYARLVSLDKDRAPEQTLAMYQAGLQAARRPDEKKLLLAKLGEVHDARTLAILEPFLADDALAAEAAAAMVSVADGLLPAGWATARSALEKASAAMKIESVQKRAAEVLQRVAEFEDFVTDWRVAGPFTQPGKRGFDLFDVPFPPEQPDTKDVKWLKQPVSTDRANFWRVDLQATPSIAGDDRVAYLSTRIYSPKAQDARLEAGSDDSLKIWLNRQVVCSKNVPRGCRPGEDQVKVSLKEGWNDLLLKVVNGDGAWAACLRVRSPDGKHLDGLRVAAEAGDPKPQP
jgi:HEAT repeat protein